MPKKCTQITTVQIGFYRLMTNIQFNSDVKAVRTQVKKVWRKFSTDSMLHPTEEYDSCQAVRFHTRLRGQHRTHRHVNWLGVSPVASSVDVVVDAAAPMTQRHLPAELFQYPSAALYSSRETRHLLLQPTSSSALAQMLQELIGWRDTQNGHSETPATGIFGLNNMLPPARNIQ